MSKNHFRSAIQGFSLLEVMIALALGLLLSIGIMSLFSSTSSTNKLQDGLARLQENGRFAVTRMEQDFRRMGGQYCSNTTGGEQGGAAYPLVTARVPQVYVKELKLPDMHDKDIKSFNGNGVPSLSQAGSAYPLSSRWFIQGYRGNTVPTTSELPEVGLAVDKRVPNSDVLTIRYLRGSGWPMAVGACGIAADAALSSGTTIKVSPQTGDDPLPTASADIKAALLADCLSPSVIPISNIAGNLLTVGDTLGGATGELCNGNSKRDVRLFNFSKDFVTVSYYLIFREDTNASARPNSAAGRLIPVLVRRENGEEQELVRGVDELVFQYGVLESSGGTRFMTADQVQAGMSCTPPPGGMGLEPNCLWRSVRAIQARLLVNTVDEVFGLDQSSRTFNFNDVTYTKADADTLNSGLQAGSQLRREFIAYVTGRNRNF